MCFDKNTGKQLWERTAHTGVPKVKRHTKSTHASSTLATDGRYIVAFFGSEGLYAYDMKGKPALEEGFRRARLRASSWCRTRSGASPARRSFTTTA